MNSQTLTTMERTRRMLASLASLIVGAASFALSYVALSEVSVKVGAVPAGLGWLVPIVVDGGVICGSAIIWSHSKESSSRPFFPFFFVGTLVIISVIINAAHAGPSILAKGIASLPPLVLLGTLELVASQGRRDRRPVASQPLTPAAPQRAADAHQGPVAATATPSAQVSAPRTTTQAVSQAVPQAAHQAASASALVADETPVETTLAAFTPAPSVNEWVRTNTLDDELNVLTSTPRRNTNQNRRPVRVRAEEPIA